MGFTLHQGLSDYHFGGIGEEFTCKQHGASHSARSFGSEGEAAAFLRSFLDDPGAASRLRRMALDLLPGLNPQRLTDQDVIRELARLLVAGLIFVIQCILAQAPGVQQEPEAPPPPPKPKAPPPVTAKHWIEFKVVEEKTKRLIPEVTLKVTLPGRGEESHTTEAKALHIRLASPGTADLLEMTHPDVWEAVEIQSG
jgi:hypothetical protein